MLYPLSIAALVSLISVDVSCSLLEALEAQPPAQTAYASQPLDSTPSLGRNVPQNEGPLPQRNFVSASVSRETVEAPAPLPQPSSDGCQNLPNFPGSPMVFNPGAHVNFVIGVPEDYRMEILNAPEGWKIITIIAPDGSDAFSLGPDLGLGPNGGVYPTNITSFPADFDGLLRSEFPFMRPLPLGSAADSPPLMPGYGTPRLQTPGVENYQRPSLENYPGQNVFRMPGPSRFPVKGYAQPGSQIPGQPEMYRRVVYPDSSNPISGIKTPGQPGFPGTSEVYLEGAYPNERQPPRTPEQRPGFQTQGIEYPDGQYPDGMTSPGSRGPGIGISPREKVPTDIYVPAGEWPRGYSEPGSQTPITRIYQPGLYQPSDNYPDGTRPDDTGPLGSQMPGYNRPFSQTPGAGILFRPADSRPDDQYPDKASLPGSNAPGMGLSPRQQPEGRYPNNLLGPSRPQYPNDMVPGSQSPGMEGFAIPRQLLDSYDDGQQPDNRGGPSGPQFQILQPDSQRPPGIGRFPVPRGQDGTYPGGQSPGNPRPGLLTPELGRPQEPNYRYPAGPQSPYGRPDNYRDTVYPGGTNVNLRPGTDFPSAPGNEIFPQTTGRQEQYPNVQRTPSGVLEFVNQQTPGLRGPQPQSSGLPDMYQNGPSTYSMPIPTGYTPGSFYPDMGVPSQRGQPVRRPPGQSPNGQISPSTLLVPTSNQPWLQQPGMNYNGQGPTGSYRPSDSRFHEPVSPAPETGRYSNPYQNYPGSQSPDNSLRPSGRPFPGYAVPGFQRPRTTVTTPAGLDRFPEGQYPGMVEYTRQINIPSVRPSGQILESVSPIPVYQTQGSGQPSRPSFTTRGSLGDQSPDGASGYLRFITQGRPQPGQQSSGFDGLVRPFRPTGRYPEGNTPDVSYRLQGSPESEISVLESRPTEMYPGAQYPNSVGLTRFLPGTKVFSQSSGPSRKYPDGFAGAEVSQYLGTERPVIIIDSTNMYPDGQYPDDVGALIQSLVPGYESASLLPVTEFGQPSQPAQRYPAGMLPDGMSPASPRFQSGPLTPGPNIYPTQSKPYGQIQGRSEVVFFQGAPTNMNTRPQFFPQGYEPEFQERGSGMSPVQIRLLKQGSDLPFPDLVRYILEPYFKSEQGRPNGYGREIDITTNPGQKRSGLTQPEPGSQSRANRPTGPYSPDMSPLSSTYINPGFQTIPQGTPNPNPRDSSTNTVDFPRAPEDQGSAQGELLIMNAPLISSPRNNGSVPERSPTGRETQPGSQHNMKDGPGNVDSRLGGYVPSAGMHPQTPGQSPVSPEYVQFTDGGSPRRTSNTQQIQPTSWTGGTRSPDNFGPGQSGSPSGRITLSQNPSSLYSPRDGQYYSPENRNPTGDGSPMDTISSQLNPSMGQISTDSQQTEILYEASSTGTNPNQQGSPMRMILRDGSEPRYDVSYLRTGSQGVPSRFIPMDGSEGGEILATRVEGPQITGKVLNSGSFRYLNPSGSPVITRYPQSTSMDGPMESVRVIPSMSTYSSGSPQSNVVQTSYQTTPAVNAMFYSSPHNQETGQSSQPGSPVLQTQPTGGNTYRTAPSTSFETVYHQDVPSGGQASYSPSAQYQQPRQSVVTRWPGSSSDSAPSYQQTYDPIKALRSLDTE